MEQVYLYVYDLTGGMAKMLSMAIIGKQIDGVWHTSIVAYGSEYFFGGGICCLIPLSTPYGTPVEKIPMGKTSKTRDEFNHFLRCVTHRSTMDTYHIINHNCNNFTDECMRFLLNTKIPSHITGLPAELLNTPLGQQFAPIVNNMMTMKIQLFEQNDIVNEHFADYASHSLYFSEFKAVDSYPSYDEFAKKTGILVFWDPRNDESLGLAEAVKGINAEIAFCDTLRTFYLASEVVPAFRLFIHGEKINDYSLQEFKDSVNDIKEMVSS